MIGQPGRTFRLVVAASAARVGFNAPAIADDILRAVLPRTMAAADDEGAAAYLRTGLIAAVRQAVCSPSQEDWVTIESIGEPFRAFIHTLRRYRYFVEAQREYVGLDELIADPPLLADACQHLRRKGVETIEEAQRLERLYAAVTDSTPARPRRKRQPPSSSSAELFQ